VLVFAVHVGQRADAGYLLAVEGGRPRVSFAGWWAGRVVQACK
jgi:hypothetical protein